MGQGLKCVPSPKNLSPTFFQSLHQNTSKFTCLPLGIPLFKELGLFMYPYPLFFQKIGQNTKSKVFFIIINISLPKFACRQTLVSLIRIFRKMAEFLGIFLLKAGFPGFSQLFYQYDIVSISMFCLYCPVYLLKQLTMVICVILFNLLHNLLNLSKYCRKYEDFSEGMLW